MTRKALFDTSPNELVYQAASLSEMSKKPSRPEVKDPIETQKKLKAAAKFFLSFLFHKLTITKRPEAQHFSITPEALVDTLGLADLRPPVTQQQMDQIVFSVSRRGIKKINGVYKVEDPEALFHEARQAPQRWVLSIFQTNPRKAFTSYEIAEMLGFSVDFVAGQLRRLKDAGQIELADTRSFDKSSGKGNTGLEYLYKLAGRKNAKSSKKFERAAS